MNASDVRYWIDQGYSMHEIAAISFAGYSTVQKWRQGSGMPESAVFFMQLYHGEKTISDWEDAVELKAEQSKLRWRKISSESSKKARQRKPGVKK